MKSAERSEQVAPGSPDPSRRCISLFVLIDALGWRYIEERDFLGDILPYRRPLRTVLGYSSGAIPTILTGMPPAETGHWNLFYYDPLHSPFRWIRFFHFLPDGILNHRVTTKIVKEMGRRLLGMGPLFDCGVPTRLLPWFNYVEKRNIYGRGGIPGKRSIIDRLAETNVPHRVYSYHDAADGRILEQVKRDLADSDASVFFIYLSEMDLFLHAHCLDPDRVAERIRWYERGLRSIFRAARTIDPSAAMAVFSDHGMTPVRTRYDLVSRIEALGCRMPGDYLAVYDSTMARFWFFSEESRRKITSALDGAVCGRILSDAELSGLGIRFDDRRYGELVFLLHPGWLLARSGFNGPRWVPAGMHGYHPDDPYSDGIFLSDSEPAAEVRTIAHVHRFMLDRLDRTGPASAGSSRRDRVMSQPR